MTTDQPHGRWGASGMDPTPIAKQARYSSGPTQPPVWRTPVIDSEGRTLGYLWADSGQAAGWVEPNTAPPTAEEGRARVRASGIVWAALARAYARGVPASDVLSAGLLGTLYEQGPMEQVGTANR